MPMSTWPLTSVAGSVRILLQVQVTGESVPEIEYNHSDAIETQIEQPIEHQHVAVCFSNYTYSAWEVLSACIWISIRWLQG